MATLSEYAMYPPFLKHVSHPYGCIVIPFCAAAPSAQMSSKNATTSDLCMFQERPFTCDGISSSFSSCRIGDLCHLEAIKFSPIS